MRERQFNDLLAVKVPGVLAGLTKAYVPLKTHGNCNFVYVNEKDLRKSMKIDHNAEENKKSGPKKSRNPGVVKKNPTVPE